MLHLGLSCFLLHFAMLVYPLSVMYTWAIQECEGRRMEHEPFHQQSSKFLLWSRVVRWIWLVLLFMSCLFSLIAAMDGNSHFNIAAIAFGSFTLLALVPFIILDKQLKQ